ncbi:MAG: sodium:solute symporter [Bdellovibrionaceae bacterium]|nr:sodium:solute symporter [Pseudobdellovibrionaceae bacterium]
MASQLRKLNLVTLGDLFRLRLSKGLEKMVVLILIPSTIIWSAAQVRALGQIVTVITPLTFETACVFAAIFVILYTSMGGLLGDVVHDVIQGAILIVGLMMLLIFSINYIGDFQTALAQIPAERWSFVRPGETWLQKMDAWAVPILGSLVAQELISRVLACKTPEISRKASIWAAFLYMGIGLIPAFIALIGNQLPFEVAHKDQFLPTLAQNLFPPALFVVFMGALIAAILSTVDSTLLTISAFTTHNLMGDRYYNLSEKKKLFVSRSVVVATGLVAYFLAHESTGIYDLVILASSFGTSGVLVVTLISVWKPEWAQRVPAWVCLLCGMVAYPLANRMEVQGPFLTSIFVAVVAYAAPFVVKKLFFPKLQLS